MKRDEQNLLPAHLAFYKKKWFWAVVLFLIVLCTHVYTYVYVGEEYIILSSIFLPVMLIENFTLGKIPSDYITIFLYAILLYTTFFKKKINFYTLITLITLVTGSPFLIIYFIENFV